MSFPVSRFGMQNGHFPDIRDTWLPTRTVLHRRQRETLERDLLFMRG